MSDVLLQRNVGRSDSRPVHPAPRPWTGSWPRRRALPPGRLPPSDRGCRDESGRHGAVDVGEFLQVIGVAADGFGPAGLKRPPGGVVQHVPWGSMAPAHLADGLLGENGVDRGPYRLECAYVTGRGEAEAITEAGRRARPNRDGVSHGSAERNASALSAVVSATTDPPSRSSVAPAKAPKVSFSPPRPPAAWRRPPPARASRWRLRSRPATPVGVGPQQLGGTRARADQVRSIMVSPFFRTRLSVRASTRTTDLRG